jgi:ubiquinone/menaquinone biosynthesis C-methylase UbiE
MELNDRQVRELDYHREHAASLDRIATKISYGIVSDPVRRWWNAYWSIYTILLSMNWKEKKALVVGCGFGQDAVFLSKMGADVSAFDLSPDMLSVARDVANRAGFAIDFRQLAAEKLDYPSDFFDLIFVRDILHHCDIPKSMAELVRVSRPGAFVVVDEMYTHSSVQKLRMSRFVSKWLYPKMVRIIYNGQKPYITEDERKLTQHDARLLRQLVPDARCDYFNVFVNRILPDKDLLCKIDRILIVLLRPLGGMLGGRLVLTGRVGK